VVEALSVACAEGRLTLEELGARVEAAYGAVQRSQLVALLADLPEPAAKSLEARQEKREKATWIVSVMGETKRRGHWRLPARSKVVTVMGETVLDLRQAVIEGSELEMTTFLLMGEQRVIVPPGVEVEVSGIVFMGGKRVDVAAVRPRPGVPRLRLKVRGMMGEVRVRTG
jgi:hypothetical protein